MFASRFLSHFPRQESLRRAAAGLLATSFSWAASAATYYVDTVTGNDAWAGTTSAATANLDNGPWRSLARVSSATLNPGDTVLLRCDRVWRERLALRANGTSSAPITVGQYGTPCAAKPLVSAAQPIPNYAWTNIGGNIYQARFPVNLLRSSGDLLGFSSWSRLHDQTLINDLSCVVNSSACITLTSGTTPTIAISGNFSVEAGNQLNISARLRIPAGVSVDVIPRRGAAPYDTIGATRTVVGTGAWQTLTYDTVFTATTTAARIDFVVRVAGQVINLSDVRASYAGGAPTQLMFADSTLAPAHHPNRGFDPARPAGMFATIAANADRVAQAGGTGSTYLQPAANLALPEGASIVPGMGVVVRTNGWMMDELTVASYADGKIYFDRPTTFPLDANWGFYLTGARWMLDSPGEWHVDTAAGTLAVWMPDGLAPAGRLASAVGDVGIDFSNGSFITLDGVDVDGFVTGVRMRTANGLVLRNARISNSGNNAVDAVRCSNCEVSADTIVNSRRDALSAVGADGQSARSLRVMGNRIVNSGVRGPSLGALDVPIRSYGALRAGSGATVQDNVVINAGYIGILLGTGSFASGNRVEYACISLNDCAGIYTAGTNNGSVIDHNTVQSVIGNTDGMPSQATTLTAGIYLDELAAGVTVSNNTLIGADDGVHLHDAASNIIAGNTFFGNRRFQVWAQETSNRQRAAGDVFGNQINDNLFFPAVPQQPVQQETIYASTSSFASYRGNRYSTLLSPTVANELWSGGGGAHDLPRWQSVRGQDMNGSQVSSIGYATFSTTGGNLIPNGNLAAGRRGWTWWNATAPLATAALESCPQGNCIRLTAGGSASLLSSPNFSTVQGQWYRISFDARTQSTGQPISVIVRRGGGGTNGYEGIAPSSLGFAGSTAWTRYSFVFQATKTVNAADPVTGDLGVRVDFERVMPATSLAIGNLEMVPLNPVETSLKTRILVNATAAPSAVDCPDQASNPALCTQFVKFSDGLLIAWPYTLQPHSSEVIYSRDSTLVDDDGDGVPNFQDQCSATPTGAYTNARGCSFSQAPAG
ncbi:MAG: right-handed parallel beta-helix repeat-containing protein [Gammaproteobacteria bacterium]|nr:right-handed parallel beta-helix repeat-containing protein [Gammaproteobacteria bacterium]